MNTKTLGWTWNLIQTGLKDSWFCITRSNEGNLGTKCLTNWIGKRIRKTLIQALVVLALEILIAFIPHLHSFCENLVKHLYLNDLLSVFLNRLLMILLDSHHRAKVISFKIRSYWFQLHQASLDSLPAFTPKQFHSFGKFRECSPS